MKFEKLALSAAIASVLAVGVTQANETQSQDSQSQQSQHSQESQAQISGAAEDVLTAASYEDLYAKGISVEEFLDAEVVDAEGDSMGEVEDLIIGADDNRITGMVIETGGFLDIGDSHLLYPFDKAEIQGSEEVRVGNIDGEHVEEMSLYQDIEGDSVGERWRVTEMIGGLAYTDGEPYGRIDDVIIDKSGNIMAVIVQADVMYDDYSYYAWPYLGYDAEEGIYDVPMDKRHAFGEQPFDSDKMQSD